MASPTGDNDAGSSGDAISFQLQSIDLPSRRLIGKGLSGVVYETIWKGERFARKDFVDVPSDVFLQEAAVLVNLKDHKNVVKTYGWTVDKRSCSLVMEYMDDDLLSLLKKVTESKQYNPAGVGFGSQSSASTSGQPFDLPEVLDVILQLARGMESLHNQGIAHGDLKTKNILVTHVNDDGQKLVKVTDFGLVRTKRKSESNVSCQVRKLDIVKWKAPEYLEILFRQLNVSNDEDETSSDTNSNSEEPSTPLIVRVDAFAADVYSFAVICSQILTGKDPYPNLGWKALRDNILSGSRPNLPDACPLLLRKLLISCWGDPALRPTFSKICEEVQEHVDTFSVTVTGACEEQGGSSYSTLDEDQIQTSYSSSPRTRPLPHQLSKAGPARASVKSRLTGFLRLFKRKDSERNYSSATSKMSAERPELYLELTRKVNMKQAKRMAKVSTSPKFNYFQCQYLLDKLDMAVHSTHSFIYEQINTWNTKFDSSEDSARSLEIFKLLYVLGKEVDSFVQACCKDMWVQSAIMLVNVFDHILSLGFNLELYTIVFRKKFGVLTLAEVARVREVEAEILKERANRDELRLYEDVNVLILSSREISHAEWQLGMFLLEKLERQRQGNPDYALKRLHQPGHPDIIGRKDILKGMNVMDLKRVKPLGSGSRGVLHKAVWLGVEVAVKTYNLEDFEKVVSIWEGLCHPNIISFLGYTINDHCNCFMIMELMDGNLHSLMEERMQVRMKESGYYDHGSPFSISEAIHIMLQVAQGMLYLHNMRIIHRDLKSMNILVKYVKVKKVVQAEFVHAKVSDFDLSEFIESDNTYSRMTPNLGTMRWMAPEVIKVREHLIEGKVFEEERGELANPFKCDIYSFAMVCYEILTGKLPFYTSHRFDVKKQVLAGNRPQLPNECPIKLRNLIEACWSPKPIQRPHFHDICVELRTLKDIHFIECASL